MKQLSTINFEIEEDLKNELLSSFEPKRKRIFMKIFGAALGSIPWVGGFLSAILDFKDEQGQVRNNELYNQWLEEHSDKIKILTETLVDVATKINESNEEIDVRLESDEYLQIVRKSFRSWDNADTTEKKEIIKRLLINSSVYKLVQDDLIRLFLDWINLYHEIHFSVIREIYTQQGITRYGIWKKINGKDVREDSMEAHLFKLLIRDLSTGGVIQQLRSVDYSGNYLKQATRSKMKSSTLKSAFDGNDGYELTELGEAFVHYTMTDLVKKLD